MFPNVPKMVKQLQKWQILLKKNPKLVDIKTYSQIQGAPYDQKLLNIYNLHICYLAVSSN